MRFATTAQSQSEVGPHAVQSEHHDHSDDDDPTDHQVSERNAYAPVLGGGVRGEMDDGGGDADRGKEAGDRPHQMGESTNSMAVYGSYSRE